MYYLFISFFVFFTPIAGGVGATEHIIVSGEVFAVEKLPSGTRMVIPSEIIAEYRQEEGWGKAFNYLSHYYAVPGPSTLKKGEHTYYVPLRIKSAQNQNLPGKTVLVDLMNIQKEKKENIFTTLRETYIPADIIRGI